jgi:hypothetical protein
VEVVVVAVDDTLAEVDDDLAHGDHAMARRRLREALAVRPHRLDLRVRLASVYRDLGDLPQAGRWGYLSQEAPEEEVEAFRTACGHEAGLMLEALAWGEDDDGDAEDQAQITAVAWERIAELRREATAGGASGGGPVGTRVRASGIGAAPTAYPFTPAIGITKPLATAKKPVRFRERLGLALIFVGLLVVLGFLLAMAAVVVWAIAEFVRHTYL